MVHAKILVFLVLPCFIVPLVGCARDHSVPMATAPVSLEPHHAHGTVGPHHGQLIELGNDAYHAEFVHEEETVTVYVLNGQADQPMAIEASNITINVTHGGAPRQFLLTADPTDGDVSGKSSRFVSGDKDLVACIDVHSTTARVALTIDGKQYRGTVSHDHAHHDHVH